MKNKFIYSSTVIIIIAVSILFFSNTDNSQNLKEKNTSKDKLQKLYVDMFQNGSVIVYPTNISLSLIQEYKTQLKDSKFLFRGLKMDMVADTAVTDSLLKNKTLVVIGTEKSNNLYKRISDKLPIKINAKGFEFEGYKFESTTDIGIFAYNNPFNENKISFFIYGNNDEYLLNNIKLRNLSGIQINRSGENILIGEFIIDENNNWILDKYNYWEFAKNRKSYPSDFGNIIYHYENYNSSDIQIINKGVVNKSNELKQFFGKKFNIEKFDYHIYNSFETKGLIIENTDLSSYDIQRNTIDITKNNWINGEDYSSLAGYLVEKNFNHSKYKFFEDGVATYFSNNWRANGFEFWASKIYLSNIFPSLNELLDEKQYPYLSNFITQPLGASFISFYVEKYGREKIIELYKRKSKFSENEVKEFEIGWKNYLQNLSKKYEQKINEDKNNFPQPISDFQKGLSYAHEGYRIHNGYLSTSSFLSLKKAVELGTNSISVIPYTSTGDPQKPLPLRFWKSAFSENDETIIYLEHISNKLNINIMLKPHIYLRRGWPGDIEMKNEKDWKLFFKSYKNWILHYALISEMYKIPLLCIGNELVKTTITHNDDWVELINEIRSIYNGKLTYGANWGDEFEKIKFWDHLDFIGISEYYPLSKKENPTDDELLSGAEKLFNIISNVQKKYNKPVIFTEVGFRSSQYPWMTAREKETRKITNEENQARSYNAILKTAYDKKWLVGMYWWKWPSSLKDEGDPQDDLYTPYNKSAEEILNKWYSKKWD